jgi:hypothetical protein
MISLLGIAIGLALLGAGIAFVARRAARRGREPSFKPEEFLLEEAVVTRLVAPGMIGKAELRRRGVVTEILVKAVDGAQAFQRGARIRVIDLSGDTFLVEPADEEHLVR